MAPVHLHPEGRHPCCPAEVAARGDARPAAFTECEIETTPSSDSCRFELSAPPLFSVEFDPSLEIDYTLDGDLEKLAVDLEPSVSIEGGIEIAAAFEGKVECKVELFVLRAPVGGPLSALISGLIPIGVGIEAGGKMNIADAGIKTTASVSGNAQAGSSARHRILTTTARSPGR